MDTSRNPGTHTVDLLALLPNIVFNIQQTEISLHSWDMPKL